MPHTEPVVVLLGNTAGVSHLATDPLNPTATTRVARPDAGCHLTQVTVRPDAFDEESIGRSLETNNDRMIIAIDRVLGPERRRYVHAVAEIEQLWGQHSDGAPAFVASDDQGPEEALAEWFRCPAGYQADYRVDQPEVVLAATALPAAALKLIPEEHFEQIGDEHLRGQTLGVRKGKPPIAGGLMVNAARDGGIRLMYDTSRTSLPGPWNVMAISANATAEAAANTALPGRITTAGGGLVPGAITYAHTAATATWTATRTFTANGTDALPVTVAKMGLEDAGGGLGHEKLLSSTATISVSGDNATITFTGTWSPS